MTIDNQTIAAAKSLLNSRLNKEIPLESLDQQYKLLFDLLERTIEYGESNSVLMMGVRGTAKTTVVRNVLEALQDQYYSEHGKQFFVIHLNGLYHTNDRIALKSILRQLNLEADLDHDLKGSFAEQLDNVLATLKAGSANTTPIIFVLEEMDLITQHSKQILLYNLFDISQSNQNPIAVVGVTSRMDTLLLLEKRVKSRFSHRTIDFYPLKTLDEFINIARSALTLRDSDKIDSKYKDKFNSIVEKFFDGKEARIVLNEIFQLDRDVSNLLIICEAAIQNLSQESPYFDSSCFIAHQNERLIDYSLVIIQELSILEICLLIAIKKLLKNQETIFNFEMVYDEYQEFLRRVRVMGRGMGHLRYTKAVALKAFEHMESYGILEFSKGAAAQCPKEYHMAHCLLSRAQIDQGLTMYPDILPQEMRKWAS